MNGDFARALNSVLLVVSSISMLRVTWRLAPKMKWYELVGRQGITLTYAGLTGAYWVGLTHPAAPYTVFTFIITAGLTGCTLAYVAWAHHLPKRKFRRRPKKEAR